MSRPCNHSHACYSVIALWVCEPHLEVKWEMRNDETAADVWAACFDAKPLHLLLMTDWRNVKGPLAMRQVDSGSEVCNSVALYWLLAHRILPKCASGTLLWLVGGFRETVDDEWTRPRTELVSCEIRRSNLSKVGERSLTLERGVQLRNEEWTTKKPEGLSGPAFSLQRTEWDFTDS